MFKVEPIRYLADDEFEVAKRKNQQNHIRCRVRNLADEPLVCMGYHCHKCGASVGMMGHADTCRIRRASGASAGKQP